MRHLLLISLMMCSLFFTSCGKDDFSSIPSEGYFVIEVEPDGKIFLRSTAPAPHPKGVKNYLCRTSTGLVVEIADPFCGTPKRMDITEILYVSHRDEHGSAIYKSYSPTVGDQIFVDQIYHDDEKHNRHEETLQLVILKENDLKF